MHGRVFSDMRVNSALYYLSSGLVWSNPKFFKESHLHHHSRTFSEDDIEAKGVQKWGAVDVFFYAKVDIPFMARRLFYTLLNSFGLKYVNGAFHNISKAHQIAALTTLLLQIVFSILIYCLTKDVFIVLLWILLPFTGQLINKLLAQSQHMGLISLREFGPLSHSRSIKLPKLFTFLYAGMNYHAEHHLIPSIPYYHLEKASDFLVEFFGHQVVDWRRFYKNEFLSLVRNCYKVGVQ